MNLLKSNRPFYQDKTMRLADSEISIPHQLTPLMEEANKLWIKLKEFYKFYYVSGLSKQYKDLVWNAQSQLDDVLQMIKRADEKSFDKYYYNVAQTCLHIADEILERTEVQRYENRA